MTIRNTVSNHIKRIEFCGSICSDDSIIVSDTPYSYNLNISESENIEILFSSGTPFETSLNINVSVADDCCVYLLEKYENHDSGRRVVFHYNIGKNSKLIHGKLVLSNNSEDSLVYEVSQSSCSEYDMFSLFLDRRSIHDTVNVHLHGENSVCNLKSVAFLHDDSSVTAQHSVIHEAPDGYSSQYFKAALDNKSKCDFRGNIIVQRNASGTDGKQLCKTLLLSDDAQMNVIPQLEIMNDNVKCSHGNAIGSLDENAIFYLCSRGLSVPDAKKLLLEGFIREIIDEIPSPEWRDSFISEIWSMK